jgi:hypothetical protein
MGVWYRPLLSSPLTPQPLNFEEQVRS